MLRKIRIKAGDVEVSAELNGTSTAHAIWDALPINGRVNRWGDEIYFQIPVSMNLEQGQDLVEVGDLGYWPGGKAFCIFFGPTPMSTQDQPVPASPCTVFGRITGDAIVLRKVPSGSEISVQNMR